MKCCLQMILSLGLGVGAIGFAVASPWASTKGASQLQRVAFDRDFGAAAPARPDPTGAGEIVVEPPRPVVTRVVKAVDYGLSADRDDNGAAIQEALAAARRIGASRLELAPGVYRCFDAQGIFVEGFEDFTIDGCGAELVFRRPPSFPMIPSWDHDENRANIIVRGCRRVRLGNFDMDWDWRTMPLATCARVTAVHVDPLPNRSYCDFELLGHGKRHPYCGRLFPVQRTQQMSADFRHFEKGPQWWSGTYEGDAGSRADWLDPTHVRVYPAVRREGDPYWDGPNKRVFRKTDNASWTGQMKVGDFVRIAHFYYGKGGVALDSNEHLELHDVNVYACFGHGLYVCGSQRHWMVKNVRFVPRDFNHPITSTADSIHFTRSHGDAIFDNLTVSHEADDAINVHDRFTVAKKTGPRELTVILERGARYFMPGVGHEVELRAPGLGPLGWRAKAEAVSAAAGTIRFGRDLPPQPAEGWYCVFDRTASSDRAIIRNCTFDDVEMRILVNASNVTVEDCLFRRTNCDALRVMADYSMTYWAEGMGSTNVVVRNCTFDWNCVREIVDAPYGLGADFSAWIGVPAGVKPESLYRPFVSSVLIEGCTFRDSLGYFADIRCGQDFTFRNNRLELTGRRTDARATVGSARLENTQGVRFENTVIAWPRGRALPTLNLGPDAKDISVRGTRVEWR